MTFVRYKQATGFYEGSYAKTGFASAADAKTHAWNYVKGYMPTGALAISSTADFYNYMFAEDGFLQSSIKATDSEELKTVIADNTIIPAFALPMIASYLESKFIINNMGQTTDAIETAKNG